MKQLIAALMFALLGTAYAQSANEPLVIVDRFGRELPIVNLADGNVFQYEAHYIYDNVPVDVYVESDGLKSGTTLYYMRRDCQGQSYTYIYDDRPALGPYYLIERRTVYAVNLNFIAERIVRSYRRLPDGRCSNERPGARRSAPVREIGQIAYALPLKVRVRSD